MPIVGLEAIITVQPEKETFGLFVADNTIISKSENTIFYINGLVQMDTILIVPPKNTEAAITNAEALQLTKIPSSNYKSELTAKIEHKNTCTSTFPESPWNNKPLQRTTFCGPILVVTISNICLQKQIDKVQFHIFLKHSELLRISGKSLSFLGHFTFISDTIFGKNSTEFSSRPPPVSG